MKFGLIILAAFALIVILALIANGIKKRGKTEHDYYKRNPLTENEQVMYWRLIKALPDHIILAQVGMSRCVGTTKTATFGTISQKSIDFVVCNKASEIIAAIEIDDKSHNSKSRKKADSTKDRALSSAGIRRIRWKANNLPNEIEIRATFNKPINVCGATEI